MPRPHRARARIAWGLCLAWAVLGALGTALAPAFVALVPSASSQSSLSLLVVVHPGVDVRYLDRQALQMIFLRRRLTWDSGARILPFNYSPGHLLRSTFERVVLGFRGDEGARYWIDARIRFGTEAPRSLSTPSLAARVVTQLPGSISYLPEGDSTQGLHVVARVSGAGVSPP